jgi:hypothetical protein
MSLKLRHLVPLRIQSRTVCSVRSIQRPDERSHPLWQARPHQTARARHPAAFQACRRATFRACSCQLGLYLFYAARYRCEPHDCNVSTGPVPVPRNACRPSRDHLRGGATNCVAMGYAIASVRADVWPVWCFHRFATAAHRVRSGDVVCLPHRSLGDGASGVPATAHCDSGRSAGDWHSGCSGVLCPRPAGGEPCGRGSCWCLSTRWWMAAGRLHRIHREFILTTGVKYDLVGSVRQKEHEADIEDLSRARPRVDRSP